MAKNWREVLRVDRIIHTSLWIGVLCLVIVGCIPEGVDIPGYNPDSSDTTEVVPALEVSVPDGSVNYFADGIAFECIAHEISVVFRVAEEWTAKVVDDEDNPVSWCRLNSSLGSAGLHEMKVSVEENATTSSRSARIVLMAFEDVSKVATITVKQEGVALFLERTCYEVTPKDTTIAVELKANVDFEYKIIGADWVREQPTASRALTSHSVAFTIDANPSHKSREAKIIFYSSQYAVSDTLTIAQQGLTPTLTVPEGHTNYFAEGLVFSFMKGEAEVTFHSNVEWTLQVADSTAWCSVSQTSGKAGLHKVKVRVTDNDTYEHRSAVLRLMCDTIEMGEIQVVQNRKITIQLDRQDYTVSCEATTIDVSVSTNVDFEYKIIDADWIRERQSATRGLITHNLTFEVDANPSTKPREARIAFYSSEYAVADTLTITQRGIILPSATTGEASNITLVSATLSGTVNNTEEPLTCGFIYGTSSTLSFTSGTRVSTKSQNDFSIDIDGLTANTTYYYCAYVVFDGDFALGEVRSFTTASTGNITVTTGDATSITANSVSLSGTISNAYKSLTCGIIYGTSSTLSSSDVVNRSTTSQSGDFTIGVTGLNANTTYYYRAYVIVDNETRYGEIRSFTTKKSIVVTTGDATNITTSGATLAGSIDNAEQSLTCGIIYGTTPSLSTSETKKSTTSQNDFSFSITGLNSNTTYYYRAYAIYNGIYKYGEICSFSTKGNITVTTGNAANITSSGATLTGTINNASRLLNCGIIYDTSSTLSSINGTKVATTAQNDFSLTLTGLEAGTTYYYRAYVVDNGTYQYGDVRSFSTKKSVTITTGDATNITASGATLAGSIENAYQSLTCGIIYGVSSTLSSTNGTMKSTTSLGNYFISVEGLSANTTYYYCAYVIESGEYKYGEVKSFKTKQSDGTSDTDNMVAVDLGLSVKWASCNVGASSPEDYGGYYAWGETEVKSSYDWTTYSWCEGSENTMTKYCLDSSYGIVDGKKVLEQEDDVARIKWGDGWRMPTLDEIKELSDNCSWQWTQVNGVKGHMATGPNGNSIFLPAAGNREAGRIDGLGLRGYFWSVTLNDDDSYRAYRLYIDIFQKPGNCGPGHRMHGFNVRPVMGEALKVITITTGNATSVTANSASLSGVVNNSDKAITCGIIYGTSSSLSSTSGTMKSTTSSGSYSISLTGLSDNTTYYYRAYAIVDGAYKYGDVLSFTTKKSVTVTTGGATNVTTNGATLAGTISNAEKSLTCGIIYGTSSSLSSTSGTMKSTTSSGSYSISLTGLSDNTTYYYRAYVLDAGTYKYGDVLSFTTEAESSATSGDIIDLGLSVKWASCNVGANSPEDYGGYYAWGETDEKNNYTSGTYAYYGVSIGTDISGTEYDVAHTKLGDKWRMPTKDELGELYEKCTWQWTAINGINGYKVVGPNGNSIFLPAAGYRYGTTTDYMGMRGNTAYYWSSTKYATNQAYNLQFYKTEVYGLGANGHNGYDGHSVRPVYGEISSNVEVSVTTGDVTNVTTSGATLAGTVSNAEQSLTCGIIYGTSSSLSSTSGTKKSTTSSGSYSISLTGLTTNTTYYYRAYVIDAGTYKYGEVKSFTTKEVSNSTVSNKTYTVNGVSFRMIAVSGGTFTMGAMDSDSEARSNEQPAHQVTLSNYSIGETEVTQELWLAVMGTNPSRFSSDLQRPVEKVSWSECQTFIAELNNLTGANFRMPTEAEWEFAARGGNESKGYKFSGSNTSSDVAWCLPESSHTTHAVKTLKPNELGLYDMSGNVWEWCSDWDGSYSSASQTNPTGPSSGTLRVARGGSWAQTESRSRITYRHNETTVGGKWDSNGLRLAQ